MSYSYFYLQFYVILNIYFLYSINYIIIIIIIIMSWCGVDHLVKTSLPLPYISIYHIFSYSDYLTISFTQKHKSISITVIYKPPKPEFASFLSEFNDLATDLISSPTYHLINLVISAIILMLPQIHILCSLI